jgi:hypothetical protein
MRTSTQPAGSLFVWLDRVFSTNFLRLASADGKVQNKFYWTCVSFLTIATNKHACFKKEKKSIFAGSSDKVLFRLSM